jgi:hypothetical protein
MFHVSASFYQRPVERADSEEEEDEKKYELNVYINSINCHQQTLSDHFNNDRVLHMLQ